MTAASEVWNPAPIPAIPGVQFRRPHADDWPGIRAGWEEAFATRRDAAVWTWRYGRNHEHVIALIAEDASGQLLAYYGGLLAEFQVDELVVPAFQPVDIYRLRRPGTNDQMVFSALAQRTFQTYGRDGDYAFAFGFPGPRSLAVGRDRVGYNEPSAIDYFTRRVTRRDGRNMRFMSSWGFDRRRIDQLWHRSRTRYSVSRIRSGDYFAHRYAESPFSYEFVCIRTLLTPHALAVVRADADSLRVVDLLWDGRSVAALEALNRALNRMALKRRLQSMSLWLNGDDELRRALLDMGWQASVNPLPIALVMPHFDPCLDQRALPQRMYVTMGDSDLF